MENYKVYVGTKIIKAIKMSRDDFDRTVKNQEIPRDSENQSGYKVVYDDGYISWSPADVFERCYRLISEKEISMMA